MLVRPATLEDVPSILNMADEWIPFNEEAKKQRRITLILTMFTEGNMVFIAQKKDTGEIIGWTYVRYYDDWFVLRKSIHIVHITVRTDCREKGVGTAMIQTIIEYFRDKLGSMFVYFFYTEAGWKNFFKKNNFSITGQHFFVKIIEKKQRHLKP